MDSDEQLVLREQNARQNHLINTTVWPIFTTLLLSVAAIALDRIPVIAPFVTLSGLYVCIQWSISVGQTRKRYQRLWRLSRHLEFGGLPDSGERDWFRQVVCSPKTAFWSLRGESLPILFALIFGLLATSDYLESHQVEQWKILSASALLFSVLLIIEAHKQRREREKDHNGYVIVKDGSLLGGVEFRVITLNNPSKANCLDLRTLTSIHHAISSAHGRTIILSAQGRVFCSGLDVDEIVLHGSPKLHLQLLRDIVLALTRHTERSISLVNGKTVAGGIALACCTTFNIVRSTASFKVPGEDEYGPLVDVLQSLLHCRRPSAHLPRCGQFVIADAIPDFVDHVASDDDDLALIRVLAVAEGECSTYPAIDDELKERINRAIETAGTKEAVNALKAKWRKESRVAT